MRYLIACLVILFVAPSVSWAQDKPSFYEEKERGWFWHETEPEPEEEKPEEKKDVVAVPPKEEKSDKVPLDVEWLRKNVELLMVEAIENPTYENKAAFAYAQRLMTDMSSRFSRGMTEFVQMERQLDESARRPTSTLSLNVFKQETADQLSQTIKSLNEKSHLWFFYSSDCPYCSQQLPIIKEFARRYELDILAISIDTGILPGAEQMETVFDTNLSVFNQFNLKYTPSIVLAKSAFKRGEKKAFTIVGEGLTTLPDLERKTLLAARNMDVLSKEQYALTTDVREINVLEDENGVIQAERELLESDKGYLAELLRKKLKDIAPVGGTRVNKE